MSRLRRHSQKKVVLPVKGGGGGGLLLSPFGSVGIVDFQRETTTQIFFVWQRKATTTKKNISLSKKEAKKGDHKRERKKVLANFFVYSLFRGLLV